MEMSLAEGAPAGAADLETRLLASPQFEAELGSQRPVRSQKPWTEVIGVQAGFDDHRQSVQIGSAVVIHHALWPAGCA